YLDWQAEAEARDHRKLGERLDLFSLHPEAPGMPFFHDRGTFIYRQLERFMMERMKELDYRFVKTPLIMNKSLWQTSGHWDYYRENMYVTRIDDKDTAVKPMNCPGHLLLYKDRAHSYKELPLKVGEFGLVHRHELSGVLSGLLRVRCFTQDDAHVYCTEDQLQGQIQELIGLVRRVYSAFGFDYHLELSTKPEKSMGDPKRWELAESALSKALEAEGLDFKINPGDGAFYGPKIDCHVKDALGRSWQCGTIQVDFSMPEKFDLTYRGSKDQEERPVMLHRAIYGSFERFFAIITEHFAGKFPLWLSPVPVRVVTVTQRANDYARKVHERLVEAGFRSELNDRTETMGKKVREAQLDHVNYVVTIGDKEVENETLAVRPRDGDVRFGVPVGEFVKELEAERDERRL
ncbi:MAG: threonine--tRNA ligase, partial [Candidatus Woesearchaeota archaeon]